MIGHPKALTPYSLERLDAFLAKGRTAIRPLRMSDVAETLGLPTVWVPHSYASCSQHAPNEHLLGPVAKEGLQIMTGLFWDLGQAGVPARA